MNTTVTRRAGRTLAVAIFAFGTLLPQWAAAQSRTYCAIEIGARGIKARVFGFGQKDGDSSIGIAYSKEINTTIVASMKDGEISPAGINDAAEAAGTLMKEMLAVRQDCKPFIVGSSGVAVAKNLPALSAALGQKTGVDAVDFITAEQEAMYGFMAAVPKKNWANTVLVDIGSGNTKIGYVADGKVRGIEVPYGSATLTRKVSESQPGVEFAKAVQATIDKDVRPAFKDASSRAPGALNRRNVIWVGGAAWATATFVRPDSSLRDFVRLTPNELRQFGQALEAKTWANAKPSAKAGPKTRAAFERDSTKVVEIFTRDNLLSGTGIFQMFLADRGVDGPILFSRSGQWIMGYAANKYADEVWADDALEQHF